MAQEVTVSSAKSTVVTCKTHLGQLAEQLPYLVNLASLVCDIDCDSVVEFQLSNLTSLVRSPAVEITVYTADVICPVFPYVARKRSLDILVMVVQFAI